MNNKYILAAFALLVATTCGDKKLNKSEKMVQLEKLKTELAEVNQKIKALEKDLMLTDTTYAENNQKTVGVTELKAETFNAYLEIQGSVDARQNVDVTARVPGVVTAIYAQEGQNVKAGQTLAQLDDQVLRKNLQAMKTQLDFATNVFNRQKSLWDQKVGTEVQYLTAKNTVESIENQIAALNEQIAMYRITSPISGSVDLVSVKLGQTTAPGVPAIKVVNLSQLRVMADVAESYAGKIKVGNVVEAYPAGAETPVKLKVDFLGKVIDPINRSFKAEINVTNNKDLFKPNQLVVLKINNYSQANAIVIPVNLVQKDDVSDYVYVVGQADGINVAERRNVVLGMANQDKIAIAEGLKVGDLLITQGSAEINAGQAINYTK